jgi:transketolase C-terminal domain/subunit
LEEVAATTAPIVVVEDHASVGALGDALRRELPGREVAVSGADGWPAFGTPPEALRSHGLDAASLAGRIAEARTLAGA